MAERKSNGLLTSSRIVFFILSLFVFCLVIHYLGKLEDIKILLLKMNPFWLLLSVVFQLATYLIFALILDMLLQKNRGTVSLFKLFKMSIVILYVNQVLPSGGISGNGYIFNQLVRRNVPSSKALSVLILESICYYIAILMLLGLFYGLYYMNTTHVKSVITYTTLTGFIFYLFLGTLMLGLSNKHTISYILQKLCRFGRIRRYIEKVNLSSSPDGHESTVKVFLKNKRRSLFTILLQLCIIICDILTVFAIINGFHIQLSFIDIGLGVLLSLVIGALPISPGSLIIYESAMTFFFTTLGISIQAALIVTLIFRFFTFWLPIPIGLLLYRNLQKR